MKYFTNEDLNYINSILNKIDVGQSVICGKIEAYNVKGQNETLNKEITEKYGQSPSTQEFNGESLYSKNFNGQYNTQQSPIQTYFDGIQKIEGNNNNREQMYRQPDQIPTRMRSQSWHHGQSQPYKGQQEYNLMKKQTLTTQNSYDMPSFSPISPFGPLTQAKSRQTFCNLIEALNQSFPDYDFTNVRPDAFTKEPNIQMVMNHVNMTLRDIFNDTDRILLWTILSGILDMNTCAVYSYNPNDNDPLGCGDGKLWTWNYFFMTKREKKIVLFTCYAKSKESMDEDEFMSDSDSEEQNMKNVDYYYPYAMSTSQRDPSDSTDQSYDYIFEQDL